MHDPKQPHLDALLYIGKYLKGTRGKGTIIKPTHENKLTMYVDAGFAGDWHKDKNNTQDPSSVYSRTGFVITYAKVPIFWMSKLQSEVALSSTEAEYIALSHAMRYLIPLQSILSEIGKCLNIPEFTTITRSTIFEDNKGAVELATCPRMRPRTKHIALKYHHFREHVTRNTTKILYIRSTDNLADIFTKPLQRIKFEYLRRQLIGW
jgi:hypothetical protein